MGLFSRSKSKSKKKGGRSRKAKPAGPAIDRESLLRWMRVAAWLIAVGGIAAGWYFGRAALVDYVGDRRAAVPEVKIVDAPPWMSPALSRQIRHTVAARVAPDPLDAESLESAAATLQQNPWVERVHGVSREFGGRIEVRAAYRAPVGLIHARDGYHLVDQHGRRLPGAYAQEQLDALDLPVITGVSAAPPREGEPWSGGDVSAGLQLATFIAAQPFADAVEAVDVTNFAGRHDASRPHLLLMTEDGAVRWGRAPGAEQFYEPPAETKLEHIQRVRRKYGSIDAGGQIVDVFGDSVFIHPRRAIRYTAGGE